MRGVDADGRRIRTAPVRVRAELVVIAAVVALAVGLLFGIAGAQLRCTPPLSAEDRAALDYLLRDPDGVAGVTAVHRQVRDELAEVRR